MSVSHCRLYTMLPKCNFGGEKTSLEAASENECWDVCERSAGAPSFACTWDGSACSFSSNPTGFAMGGANETVYAVSDAGFANFEGIAACAPQVHQLQTICDSFYSQAHEGDCGATMLYLDSRTPCGRIYGNEYCTEAVQCPQDEACGDGTHPWNLTCLAGVCVHPQTFQPAEPCTTNGDCNPSGVAPNSGLYQCNPSSGQCHVKQVWYCRDGSACAQCLVPDCPPLEPGEKWNSLADCNSSSLQCFPDMWFCEDGQANCTQCHQTDPPDCPSGTELHASPGDCSNATLCRSTLYQCVPEPDGHTCACRSCTPGSTCTEGSPLYLDWFCGDGCDVGDCEHPAPPP